MEIVREPSPPDWAPNGGVVLPPGTGSTLPSVQLAGPRRGRKTIVVVNIGANSATLIPAGDYPGTGVTIPSGGSWSLDTEGSVWARSTAGTTLDIVETWFSAGDPRQMSLPDLTRAIK